MCDQNALACINGRCLNISSIFTCVCNDGWQSDNSLFHLDNCSLPDQALLAIFLVFGVALGVPLVVMFALHARKTQSYMRQAATFSSIASIAWIAIFLSLYLENGLFEATAVLLSITYGFLNYVAEVILRMTVMPVFAVKRRKSDKRLLGNIIRIFTAIRLCYLVMGCVLAGFSRTSYNNMVVLVFIGLVILLVSFGVLLQVMYVQTLINILTVSLESGDDGVLSELSKHDLSTVLDKLQKFRKSLFVYVFNMVIINLTVIILYLALGNQLPYIWTFLSSFVLVGRSALL